MAVSIDAATARMPFGALGARFDASRDQDHVAGESCCSFLQAIAHSCDNTSACSNTVCVAFSCLSGG